MAATEAGTAPRDQRLRVTEIFFSIQGESRPAGYPTVFVRLTGCPLRCHYCDTEYAFHGGQRMSLPEIVAEVGTHRSRMVCVTGGEPLAQPGCLALLTELCDQGYEVSLETSGALDVSHVDQRVTVVMDIKTPASGEAERNLWANLEQLKPDDQLKFVICDHADYVWSTEIVGKHRLTDRFAVLFSPAWGTLEPRELADWILADGLPVRFQVQLHKYLWGEEPGH